MHGRRCEAGLSLAVLLLGGSTLAAQQPFDEFATRLDILLTTAPTVSRSVRASMIAEADAIWRQHGVAIQWLSPTAVQPPGRNSLRVLVVERRPPVNDSSQSFAVGELVRSTDTYPIALISIAGAQRLIASIQRGAENEIDVGDRRLGVVLGRALAHEIGHFVLGTHTHARIGLMRPEFSAHEFCDLRDDAFALDADAAAWLRARDVERFAYVR